MGTTGKQKLPKKNSQALSKRPIENLSTANSQGLNPLPPVDGSCSCSDTEGRQQQDEQASDNDLEASEICIDGAKEDEMLQGADALTIEEVVRRRARRTKQLARLYRRQYWALVEELKSKYREFYMKNGRSGWKEKFEEEDKEEKYFVDRIGGFQARNGAEIVKCAFQGCKSKPMPLCSFCYNHILSDTRQQLYKPCSYVVKSGQTKPVTCGKPVLKAAVPSLCTVHFKKDQKHFARSLKRAELNSSSSNKPAPKFHLIISEYVNHIQSKRREAQAVGPVDNADKEVVCNLNANKDPIKH